jgi:hypothetical protein
MLPVSDRYWDSSISPDGTGVALRCCISGRVCPLSAEVPNVRLICRLKGHRRSREEARMGDDMRLHSYCERCGKPMVKVWNKGWIVDRSGNPMPPAPIRHDQPTPPSDTAGDDPQSVDGYEVLPQAQAGRQ